MGPADPLGGGGHFGVLFMLQKELFGRALLIVVGCVLLYQGLSDLFTVVQISVLEQTPQKAPGRYGSRTTS
ncbi:MAG: hypothetical protein ACLSHU_02600 [Oscillospiraceae bacterium]